jgi:hypothetical protein
MSYTENSNPTLLYSPKLKPLYFTLPGYRINVSIIKQIIFVYCGNFCKNKEIHLNPFMKIYNQRLPSENN